MGQYNDLNKMELSFNPMFQNNEVKGKVEVAGSCEGGIKGCVNVVYTDRNKMQLSFNPIFQDNSVKGKIYVAEKSNINGTAKIQGNSNIKGSVEIHKFKNIKGEVNVIGNNEGGIKGTVYIQNYPHNKMLCSFGIKPFPRITDTFEPIHDTFVTNKERSLNYGEYPYIKVGRDNQGNIYRSFMKFDLRDLPTNIHITRVYLTLYSQDRRAFENLEIDTADRNWIENSITWNGHPFPKELVNIEQCENNKVKFVFELDKEMAQNWCLQPYYNFGLLLKAFDEEKVQTKTFLSKEAYTNHPYLSVEYFDPTKYVPPTDRVKGSVEIIAKHQKDCVKGTVIVNKEIIRRRIKGHVRITSPRTIYATSDIIANKNIKAAAKIVFETKIQGTVDVVYGNLMNEVVKGVGYLIANKNLKAKAEVKYGTELKGAANLIAQKNIKGTANIIKDSNIKGMANIHALNNIKGNVDIITNKNIKAKAEIRYGTELKGTTNIIAQNNIRGTVDVKLMSDISGNVNVLTNRNIKGSIYVCEKSSIKASADIKYSKKLKGQLNVIAQSYVKGTIDIISLPKPYKAFDCKANIQAHSSIKACAFISQDIIRCSANIQEINEINGTIYVAHKSNIKGSVDVKYTRRIRGCVVPMPMYYRHIKACAEIDGVSSCVSYAFIM